MTNKAGCDAGFTLVEVMVAGTMAVMIALPAASLLNRTYKFIDASLGRFQQNEQARQVLTALGQGTNPFGFAVNTRGFNLVEGIRSRNSLPSPWPLRSITSPSQFTMNDGGLQLFGDALPPTPVQCVSAATPLPDCTGTETLNPQGWLGSNPVLATTGQTSAAIYTQAGRTTSVSISISDPRRAQRSAKSPMIVTETYRSMFTLNVDANP